MNSTLKPMIYSLPVALPLNAEQRTILEGMAEQYNGHTGGMGRFIVDVLFNGAPSQMNDNSQYQRRVALVSGQGMVS